MRSSILLLISLTALAQEPANMRARAQRYLVDLIRINTTNPPGHETRAAEYLKRVATANGINAELLGDKPTRLSFVARLPATSHGAESPRPLLLIAHSDVVPADR